MKAKQIVIFACVTLVVCMGSIRTANASEKTYKIRLSAMHTPTHLIVKTANFFSTSVREGTKGRLDVQVYPAAQLYSQKESFKAVSMGSVEMSIEYMERLNVIDPLFSAMSSNEGILTNYEMSWICLDDPLYRKTMEETAKKFFIKPLFYVASGTLQFITNSKHPIEKPADTKGLLVRVSSKPLGEKWEISGGKPVIMPADETIMALQRGTVDGAWTSVGEAVSKQYWEVQKYGTVFMSHPIIHMVAMNLKFSNSLPPELRNEMEVCALKAQTYGRKLLEEEEEGLLATLKSRMQVYVLTNQEVEQWGKLYDPLVEKWLQETGERGKKLRELMFKVRKDVLAKKK